MSAIGACPNCGKRGRADRHLVQLINHHTGALCKPRYCCGLKRGRSHKAKSKTQVVKIDGHSVFSDAIKLYESLTKSYTPQVYFSHYAWIEHVQQRRFEASHAARQLQTMLCTTRVCVTPGCTNNAEGASLDGRCIDCWANAMLA